MVIVLSVPHTGTRSLCSFLDKIGVIYRQYHSEPDQLDMLRYETKHKALIPMRDPLLCFTSTLARNGLDSFEASLRDVVVSYKLLIELEKDFDCHYFRPDEEGLEKYSKIHSLTGAKYPIPDEFNQVVGNIKSSPTNYETWAIFAHTLSEEQEKRVLEELAPIRAHYGY